MWPQHYAFYLESMSFLTASALQSVDRLNDALAAWEANSAAGQHHAFEDDILNSVQNIVLQGASLSRYFWPIRKDQMHVDRGELLRKRFSMDDESAMKSRALRDMIEHFDERLDKYLATGIVGQILPQFVGSLQRESGIPIHTFRAFDPFTGSFEILGETFLVEAILSEISRVDSILKQMREPSAHL